MRVDTNNDDSKFAQENETKLRDDEETFYEAKMKELPEEQKAHMDGEHRELMVNQFKLNF
jgi:hypothetical protein